MIESLAVQNLAVIYRSFMQFGKHLCSFTGETGAGKTLLLDSIELLLGARGDKDLIRYGETEASAEASFQLSPDILSSLQKIMNRMGPDYVLTSELHIRRVLSANGPSKAYINGIQVPMQLLKDMGPHLVDFSRQHAQINLLDPSQSLNILDKYAGTEDAAKSVTELFLRLQDYKIEYAELSQKVENIEETREQLLEEYERIENIGAQQDELEKLESKVSEMRDQKESLNDLLYVRDMLLGNEVASQSEHVDVNKAIYQMLHKAASRLSRIGDDIDPSLPDQVESLYSIRNQVKQIGYTIREVCIEVRSSLAEQQELETRLQELRKAIEEYGGDWETFIQRQHTIEQEMQKLDQIQERYEQLGPIIQKAEAELYRQAQDLSGKRHAAAQELEKKLEKELADLAMEQAQFEIRFGRIAAQESRVLVQNPDDSDMKIYVGQAGIDRVSFWLSANQGESVRPLHEVASGGELSRILLALKYVLSQVLHVHTFIFDEIDAGVSGKTANLLAKKLREMCSNPSNPIQILMITHSPQVAAVADSHFIVKKQNTDDGRTQTDVVLLDMQGRITEIARMLTGNVSSENTIKVSRELLRLAADAEQSKVQNEKNVAMAKPASKRKSKSQPQSSQTGLDQPAKKEKIAKSKKSKMQGFVSDLIQKDMLQIPDYRIVLDQTLPELPLPKNTSTVPLSLISLATNENAIALVECKKMKRAITSTDVHKFLDVIRAVQQTIPNTQIKAVYVALLFSSKAAQLLQEQWIQMIAIK